MSARRDAILREMGLGPIWRLRGTSDGVDGEARDTVPSPVDTSVLAGDDTMAPADARMPRQLSEVLKTSMPASPSPGETPAAMPAERATSVNAGLVGSMDWEALTGEILACKACRLCEQRTQAVPGVGDRQADWLFVGEGPGAEEDARGEPFVGKAGKLLDAMMAAIGIQRGDKVYIANTVKCRPPLNRTPETEELAACFPYLARQIALIQPRLIVALGRPAAQSLLNTDIRIASARGKCFDYEGIPVVVTYHPAYLLRNPMDKAKAWEDLCFARRQMARLTGGDH